MAIPAAAATGADLDIEFEHPDAMVPGGVRHGRRRALGFVFWRVVVLGDEAPADATAAVAPEEAPAPAPPKNSSGGWLSFLGW